MQGPDGQIHFPKGRGHDHFDIREVFLHGFQDGDTVHAWHADIRNDNLGVDFFAERKTVLAIVGRENGIAGVFQRDARYTPNPFLVIDQNNAPAVFVRHNMMSPW